MTRKAEHKMLPIETRAALVQPKSVDEEARTVDVVWTTGARGLRRRFFSDDFEEELVVSKEAVRLDRLNNGAPVLNTHFAFDLSEQIGVVERAWIEGKKGIATLRFSMRDDVTPIWEDIKGGIVRNVSVGYQIHRREIEEKANGPDLHRIVDWEPMEISMVPIPFDAKAQTRKAEDERLFDCAIVRAGSGLSGVATRMRMRARSAGLT
ncbi:MULTISPECIES: HK97 family phage prohead protease [Afifella]|uniref:HK97 family phage prohead protease n=1 Tax=Afifella TaxID=643217 RepID=UPI000FE3C9F6|nr:hypothetical protein [Afifella aestuarii]